VLLLDSKTEIENKVIEEKQKVKNQFDSRIDELKEELEKIRNDFYKEVDEIADDALK
jgi:F0F1-type ATP synthase membrane subunit b/b'